MSYNHMTVIMCIFQSANGCFQTFNLYEHVCHNRKNTKTMTAPLGGLTFMRFWLGGNTTYYYVITYMSTCQMPPFLVVWGPSGSLGCHRIEYTTNLKFEYSVKYVFNLDLQNRLYLTGDSMNLLQYTNQRNSRLDQWKIVHIPVYVANIVR